MPDTGLRELTPFVYPVLLPAFRAAGAGSEGILARGVRERIWTQTAKILPLAHVDVWDRP